MKGVSARAPGMIGFVHNPDSDAGLLLNMTGEWLELMTSGSGRRTARPAGERWLVAVGDGGKACLAADRYITSQLRAATDYKKVLMVLSDGHVEDLTG